MKRILPVLLLLTLGLGAEEPRGLEIATPRGVALAADHHVPATPNGAAVVIAPGRGYHKDLPLLRESADALQRAGFHVLRFDWAYFTAKGKPSPKLEVEAEDLEAVLAHAKTIPGVEKILLAGKSLGSIAAFFRARRKHDDLAGLALLTFPVHPPGQPHETYGDVRGLGGLKVPTIVVCGDADPGASLRGLYRFAAECDPAPQITIVPGDHGMHDPVKTEARTLQNCKLAAHALAVWAQRRVNR